MTKRFYIQKRYLIVGPAWIGDMVMAHSLVQCLAKKTRHIDMCAPAWTLAIARAMPEIQETILSPFKRGELNLSQRQQFAKALQAKHYTNAIVLPNSFKSALIPWWAKIPKRTGWQGECRWGILNDWRRLNQKKYPLMVERFIALADSADTFPQEKIYPKLSIPETSVVAVIRKFNLDLDDAHKKRPFILAPGAEYGEAKQWPAIYYAKLAKNLTQKGHSVWFLGSPNEKKLEMVLMQEQSKLCRNFIGKTDLTEAMALLSLARFVVCNDSGLMHISAALTKPLLAIFGSSDQRFTPPLSNKAKILSLHLSCSPCFKRDCPLGHLFCLKKITPERVLHEINQWLIKCES